MSDLEMTKLCAEAMGIRTYDDLSYDPLHDDAQAMALVKRFKLTVVWTDALLDGWRVRGWYSGKTGVLCEETDSANLNHAIVECAAKIQSDQQATPQPVP